MSALKARRPLCSNDPVFLQEKYNRAVMKINQLKEEREELRTKLEAESDEIPK